MTRCPAFLLSLVACAFAALPAPVAWANFVVPVAKVAEHEFTNGSALGVVSGSWSASGGTFNSTSTTTAFLDPALRELRDSARSAGLVRSARLMGSAGRYAQ